MANAKRIDPREARKEAQANLTTEPLPSIAAGISWMFGIVSIPLLLLPPTAIITGLLAIIFGHVAKFKIKRHAELGGEGSATSGLLMGYLCFLAALALLPSIRMQSTITQGLFNSFRGISVASSGSAFEQAERSFLDSGAIATGNNKEGREIATELATVLNKKRDEAFKGPNAMEIRTLCQATDDGICVVALVPDFSEFDNDARSAMLNFVWKESQRLSFGKLRPGDDFSVVVRDRTRYHSMEFGRATVSPDRVAQPDSSFIDVTMLDSYFETSEEAENDLEEGEQDEERE